MNMFSVIIPLYNKAHTIVKTLDCVFNQTYQDFEIVIVDDGSTDDGVDVIRQNFTDNRIRIVSQKNQGVSVARNTGIQNANGEWVSFLDADDLWSDDYLEKIDKAISKFPECNYILGGRRVLNVSDNTTFNFIPANLHGRTEVIEFFQNPHIFAHISASTINREFLKKTGLHFIPGQRSQEDFTFLFQVALHTSVGYVGYPLVTYCGGVSGQATSTLKSGVRLKDGCLFRNTVIEAWLKINQENRLFPIFMKYETRHTIMNYLKANDYDELRDFLNKLSDSSKKTLFSKSELALYSGSCPRFISLNWIRFTKLIWRMHGFPRINV